MYYFVRVRYASLQSRWRSCTSASYSPLNHARYCTACNFALEVIHRKRFSARHFHPSVHCEDFSVIWSLKLYATLLPSQPDFSSSVEVRQPSHNTSRAAAVWGTSGGWLVLWASFQLYPPRRLDALPADPHTGSNDQQK